MHLDLLVGLSVHTILQIGLLRLEPFARGMWALTRCLFYCIKLTPSLFHSTMETSALRSRYFFAVYGGLRDTQPCVASEPDHSFKLLPSTSVLLVIPGTLQHSACHEVHQYTCTLC